MSARRSRTTAAAYRAAAVAVLCVVACGKDKPPPPPEESPPAATPASAADQADAIFRTRCAICHGDDGRGHGPAGAMLSPKPRDLTDATWQRTTSDDAIRAIVVKGGAAVGKSASMPASSDLESKPDVVTAIVGRVRALAAAPGAAVVKAPAPGSSRDR